jgi:hypothetical protein
MVKNLTWPPSITISPIERAFVERGLLEILNLF